jgi:microcystin-dependent protein
MEPFVGQICLFGFDFPPRGWAICAGQLLPISRYQALFSLIGTRYGGDGRTTFALPDLRGRVAVGSGQGPGLTNYTQGQQSGSERVTLLVSEMPTHTHLMTASTDGQSSGTPAGNSLGSAGRGGGTNVYAAGAANPVPMASAVTSAGGNMPHNNLQPLLALNYCIALEGIYPSRE